MRCVRKIALAFGCALTVLLAIPHISSASQDTVRIGDASPAVIDAWRKLDVVAQKTGKRSLSVVDIARLYQPIVSDIYESQAREEVYLGALSLYTNERGEVGLRLLLNLMYQANQGSVLHVEFVEGLDGLLVAYFKHNIRALISVWNDKHQLMREKIADAYTDFIDPFGPGELKQYRDGHSDFRLLSQLIEQSQVQGPQKAVTGR